MKLREMREARSAHALKMKQIVDKAEGESRGLNDEEKRDWTELSQKIDDLDSQIEVRQRQDEIELNLESSPLESRAGNGSDDNEESTLTPAELQNRAFERFIRSDRDNDRTTADDRAILAEMRAQAVGSDAAGGFTVPEDFSNRIESSMRAYGGIMDLVEVVPTNTGANLPWPTDNDSAQEGEIIAENASVNEQDITFGAINFGAFKYSSKMIRVPVEMLQDSAFNMSVYLPNKLGERLGRILAKHVAIGTGTGQPEGLTVGAPKGADAAAAAAIAYADLIELKHSVDPAYRRQGASWAWHDSTLKAVKLLLDANGRPLWQPAIDKDSPATFDGDTYGVDNSMPIIGAGNVSVCYGAMKHYKIRMVKDKTMIKLVERYAEFHQVAFLGFMRADAKLVDAGAGPVKHLLHP